MKIKKVVYIIRLAIKQCYLHVISYIIILLVSSFLSIIVNIINQNMVNEISSSMEVSSIFIGLTIAYVSLFFINSSAGFLVVMGSNSFRLTVDKAFYNLFILKTNKQNQENFLDQKFMEKYSFINNNITKVSSLLESLFNLMFSNFAVVISSVVFFAIYEPYLLIYLFLTIITSAYSYKKYLTKQYELDKKQVKDQRYYDYYRYVLIDKNHAKELRIFNFKDFFYKKWESVFDNIRRDKLDLNIKKTKLQNNAALIRLVLRILSIIFLMIGAIKSRYDIGTFTLLYGLVETSTSNINAIVSNIMSNSFSDFKYIEDLYDYLMPLTKDDMSMSLDPIVDNGNLEFNKFKELELRNVSYKYPNTNNYAIKNVSLKIKREQIICILGYNGSGKTTLSKLMTGSLIPQSGEVFINGHKITGDNQIIGFRYFGISPQDYTKYSINIRDSVAIGRIEKYEDDSEVSRACETTGLCDLINKYQDREQTILGKEYCENGIDLSGGEWQLLSITSAYMGTPEILVLDEPSASIDPVRELYLIKNFRKQLNGKTAVIISHRLNFARIADKIIMMKDGEVIEEGIHSELLSKNGYYAEIFRKQKDLYMEEII